MEAVAGRGDTSGQIGRPPYPPPLTTSTPASRISCTARAPSCDSGCPLRDRCPAADSGTVAEVTPKLRPQGRYQGSLRQRRGLLLAALADAGRVAVDQDPDAAASLVQDGLAVRRDDDLVPVP